MASKSTSLSSIGLVSQSGSMSLESVFDASPSSVLVSAGSEFSSR